LVVSILDKTSQIKKIDKTDMLSFLENVAYHYKKAEKISENILINFHKPSNIILGGMGGSAIAGEIFKDWAKEKIDIPVEVVRDYYLPNYSSEESLVLILSYSGNTEESLSAFLHSLKKGCMTFCISSGGNLIEYSKKTATPYLCIPTGMPPRVALPYLLTPLLIAIKKSGLIKGIKDELAEANKILAQLSKANSCKTLTNANYCKKLALELNGKIPAIYGFGIFASVAHRYKQQFNENSKIPSKFEVFSELNHNEIVGWEQKSKFSKYYSIIFLRDKNEPYQIKSRIEMTKNLLPSDLKTFEIWSQGSSDLAKILSTICLGDFTSVYHAILNKIDPTPVKTINQLKEKLGKLHTKEKILRELEQYSK